MKPAKLRFGSDDGVEAEICCDESHGDREDCFAFVSIAGLIDRQNYGIHPVQAFAEGLMPIERLSWTSGSART